VTHTETTPNTPAPDARDEPGRLTQHAIWNDLVGDAWVCHAELHDRQAAPFGEAAMDALGPVRGAVVLDVGCGTGGTTAQLASRGAAEVLGIDLSGPMLAAAQGADPPAEVRYQLSDVNDLHRCHRLGRHCSRGADNRPTTPGPETPPQSPALSSSSAHPSPIGCSDTPNEPTPPGQRSPTRCAPLERDGIVHLQASALIVTAHASVHRATDAAVVEDNHVPVRRHPVENLRIPVVDGGRGVVQEQ
jgi:SAM-dependent methyltransferase